MYDAPAWKQELQRRLDALMRRVASRRLAAGRRRRTAA